MRFLSRDDIASLISMRDAISLMREAYCALSEGQVHVPVRSVMPVPEHEGRALFMPVYSPLHRQIAQKVVMVHPYNPDQGLPFIHALVLLFDATTGMPLAVMDGEFITAVRTGAGCGLAADLLALPDVQTMAIFGAGVQARTQLGAVVAVRPIRRVLIFGRSPVNAARFAAEASTAHDSVDVVVATRAEQLLKADIVCTATTSLTPVFDDSHIRDGCHINGVGSFRPDMTEIPAATVCRARVFVDQRAAALEEAGDIIVPMVSGLIDENHVVAEIGEVAGGVSDGRMSADEVTFFKSVGNAVQDLAVASHAYKLSLERGVGTTVSL